MAEIIKDLRVLNHFKKYGLEFDKTFKYYLGDAYLTKTGIPTYTIFKYKGFDYKLKYFDGCFNPYLIKYKEVKK